VFTFLTVIHVIVCIFLMLVVLLQAGRGGGIGLAFGGSGGSQSVFGSSGGATFLTKLTATCAIIFFANSLALAYLSSQSDSRRLQKIAERNALSKKAEDATNSKILTDIEKQREEKAKAEALKSEAPPVTEPAEGTAADEKKAPSPSEKPAAGLKLTPPDKAKATEPAPKKKAAIENKPATDKTAGEAAAGDEKPVKKAKKAAAEKKADETAAEEKPAP
jgi:preprotein translocase subunit SecG